MKSSSIASFLLSAAYLMDYFISAPDNGLIFTNCWVSWPLHQYLLFRKISHVFYPSLFNFRQTAKKKMMMCRYWMLTEYKLFIKLECNESFDKKKILILLLPVWIFLSCINYLYIFYIHYIVNLTTIIFKITYILHKISKIIIITNFQLYS